jgi:hypothetical protein
MLFNNMVQIPSMWSILFLSPNSSIFFCSCCQFHWNNKFPSMSFDLSFHVPNLNIMVQFPCGESSTLNFITFIKFTPIHNSSWIFSILSIFFYFEGLICDINFIDFLMFIHVLNLIHPYLFYWQDPISHITSHFHPCVNFIHAIQFYFLVSSMLAIFNFPRWLHIIVPNHIWLTLANMVERFPM